MPIPVICDRCRTTGIAGAADFSHLGDLLDFEPVPRKQRVNGWDPDAQRAFIALLATTGSKRRAAEAIGRNAFGIDQLLKAPGSDSFRLAFDRAMAIAKTNGAMKLAQGVADAAARNAQLTPPSRLRGHPPSPPAEEEDEETQRDLLEGLILKFLRKVMQERQARLAGEVVAADFYLRQVSWFEVAIDLAGGDEGAGWEMLTSLRRGGHSLLDVAETPMSRLLDEKRRLLWARLAEPDRPEHPPQRYLQDCGDHSTEPNEVIRGGEDHADQRQRFADRHAADAEAQVEWEASAQPCRGHGEHLPQSAEAKAASEAEQP